MLSPFATVGRLSSVGIRRRHALCLLLACFLLAPAAVAQAATYWGGTIKGEVYGSGVDAPRDPTLSTFEGHAGKQVTMINTGQSWLSFDMTTMQETIAAGAIPLVTMRLGDGVSLDDVIAGRQDAQIKAWAQAAKAFGYPFLFRPWWEMNGNWYTSWSRKPEFIAAWRHFHDVVVGEGATNVTWAWVVNAIWNDPLSDPSPYYPGDAYVDWTGFDAYNWSKNPIQPDKWRVPKELLDPTLEVLKKLAPNKPICICEIASTEWKENPSDEKSQWISELLRDYLPQQPQIKALLWFNWNIDHEDKGEHLDWEIESSEASELAFRAGIANGHYLGALPPLTPLTKVPSPDPAPTAASASVPTPTAPLPTTSRPGPTSRIKLSGATLDLVSGSAKLPLTLPGPGRIELLATGAWTRVPSLGGRPSIRVTKRLDGATTLLVAVKPNRATRRELVRDGSAKVTITATFTPTAGPASERRVPLTLRRGRTGAN